MNYQTVVGWQRKKVLILLQESPPEIVLTLKKRPRHTKVYGQIYMKPYRLPSKKRSQPYSRWNENLPSPQLLTIHDLPQLPALKYACISLKICIMYILFYCKAASSNRTTRTTRIKFK